jgi:molybdopterin-guanine dinucleotide biosynthesis protein A
MSAADHPAPVRTFDAVILAGGAARRFGGDKPGALVRGRTLIAGVAEAVAGARRLVVVGPARPELPHALVVREEPPGSGPVPALRAGLVPVEAEWLALLAADLPNLLPEHVSALLTEASGRSGAIFADHDGRPQWLAGVWRTAVLRKALETYRGASLFGLLGPLEPALVTGSEGEPWLDCDTPADLDRVRGR